MGGGPRQTRLRGRLVGSRRAHERRPARRPSPLGTRRGSRDGAALRTRRGGFCEARETKTKTNKQKKNPSTDQKTPSVGEDVATPLART